MTGISKNRRVHLSVLAAVVITILAFVVISAQSQQTNENINSNACNADSVCEMSGFRLGTSATPGYVLTADSSGVGMWQPLGGLSGLPCIQGSGSTNYLTRWTGNKSLSKSVMYDDGNNIGIGTTNPSQKLDVAGYVKGQSGLCIGEDCRTEWPNVPPGTLAGFCIARLEDFENDNTDCEKYTNVYGGNVEPAYCNPSIWPPYAHQCRCRSGWTLRPLGSMKFGGARDYSLWTCVKL